MSVVMPTVTVAVSLVIVVEMLDRKEPRPAAIIALGPWSVDLAGRIIGIAWTHRFDTGRETGQRDYRREEFKPTRTLDVVSHRRDGKIGCRKQAALQGNVIG
jgi:hypothetical protein